MKERINSKILCTVFLFFSVLLIISLLMPMKVYAEKLTKEELTAAIAALQSALDVEIAQRKELEGKLRIFTPDESPTPAYIDCIIGTGGVCVTSDGELRYLCPQGPFTCDDAVPDPNICPEACEALGYLLVIDHNLITCLAGGTYKEFVCVSPEYYAEKRSKCPEGTVLNYNSEFIQLNPWRCEPIVPGVTVHATTDLFDLVATISLFDRARTDSVNKDLGDLGTKVKTIYEALCESKLEIPGLCNGN